MLGKNCFIVFFGKWWQEKKTATCFWDSVPCFLALAVGWLYKSRVFRSGDCKCASVNCWSWWLMPEWMWFHGLWARGKEEAGEFRDKSESLSKLHLILWFHAGELPAEFYLKTPRFKYREKFSLCVLCMFMWHTPGHLLSSSLSWRKVWACTGAHTHCLEACILSLDYQNGPGLGLKQPLTWCSGSIVVSVCRLQTCACFKRHFSWYA